MKLEIYDIEPKDIDMLPFNQLKIFHLDIINNLVDDDEWSEIRTDDYWELYDRCQNIKTRYASRMKLLLYAYLMHSRNLHANYEHLKNIMLDERTTSSVLKPKCF